jgi:hypothetical protein
VFALTLGYQSLPEHPRVKCGKIRGEHITLLMVYIMPINGNFLLTHVYKCPNLGISNTPLDSPRFSDSNGIHFIPIEFKLKVLEQLGDKQIVFGALKIGQGH